MRASASRQDPVIATNLSESPLDHQGVIGRIDCVLSVKPDRTSICEHAQVILRNHPMESPATDDIEDCLCTYCCYVGCAVVPRRPGQILDVQNHTVHAMLDHTRR